MRGRSFWPNFNQLDNITIADTFAWQRVGHTLRFGAEYRRVQIFREAMRFFHATPDDYLVSLDARTGAERWSKEIANFNQQYFLTSAPVVIENHVIVGSGNDLDSPGFLQSCEPETSRVRSCWET